MLEDERLDVQKTCNSLDTGHVLRLVSRAVTRNSPLVLIFTCRGLQVL